MCDRAYAFSSAYQFTGRNFATRGASTYPTGPGLFPVPYGGGYFSPIERDPFGPVSLGVTGYRTFSVSLQPEPGGAGAEVEDLSFLPDFRPCQRR